MPAERAARELTAILVADLVGYSRLVAADEAGTLARLDGLRAELLDPLVAEHRGRLVKVMGDGFLVAFASVSDAVACALAWQAGAEARAAHVAPDRALRFRIGVHVGEVHARDGDILGDSVNVAARLQEIADPGTVLVSQTVADHLAGAPGLRLEDRGTKALKNLPLPVRVWRALPPPASVAAPGRSPAQTGLRLAVMAAAAVVIGAAATAFLAEPWAKRSAPIRAEAMAYPLPDKPSIAVLPFANMSDDPQQGWFADGMTEDLITDLAKISGLFVISRNSVFTYKGRPVEIRQVGEELGVRYVLEGSVRRFGDQVRITGQLIDATTGGHLWAENYDGSVADIFDLQDEVRRKIVDSLEVVLTPAERAALGPTGTTNAAAYEEYLKGMALLNQAQMYLTDPLAEARHHFERSIELDPDYARAMAALAWCDYLTAIYSFTGTIEEPFRLAERSLAKEENALAYVVLSQEHFRPRETGYFGTVSDHAGAVELLERALALEPGNADIMAELAYVLVHKGDLARAGTLIDDAKRLNPSYPVWYRTPSGMVRYFRGDYAAAVEDFRVWRDAEPLANDGALWLAAAQAMSGDRAAAEETLVPWYRTHPAYTVRGISRGWGFGDPKLWKALERGLVAAGIPAGPE